MFTSPPPVNPAQADLQAALQAIPDLMFEMSQAGDYLQVWARRPDLLAADERSLVGRNVHDVLPPLAAATVHDSIGAALRDGSSCGALIELELADGVHWFELSSAARQVAAGQPNSVMVLSRDISQRVRAEAQVRDTAVRLGMAMSAADMGAWDYDFTTDTLRWSDGIFELFGLPRQPVSRELIQGIVHPDDRAIPDAAMEQAVATHTPYLAQYRVRQGDRVDWVEDRGVLQFGPHGEPLRVVGVAQKITRRKEAEAELEHHRQELETLVRQRTEQLEVEKVRAEAANRAKSAFLANMSHEIRTPLNAISGTAWLMKRDGLPLRQAERLDRIDTAGRHLLSIIDAILDLSKIEAGKTRLSVVPVDLADLLGRTVAMLADAAQAKGLALRTELDAPRRVLLGDPTRLQQLLLNFGSNAIKFTEAGEVVLRVQVVPARGDTPVNAASPVELRLEVQDTGPGIAPDALARLFEPFEQVDNSSTRQHGGTGLGLAINKRLAELMDGSVGADSTPGVGSRFWACVRLAPAGPAAPAPVAPAAGAVGDGPAGADSAAPPRARHAGLRGRRVLLAEDEPINREITADLLQELGVSVVSAADGRAALDAARGASFDAILMDLSMPGLDGLSAARLIRQLPGHAGTPIVALTANVLSEDRERCLAAGMNDFLAKPADLDDLAAMLEAVIGRA